MSQPKTAQALALIEREVGEETMLSLVMEGKTQSQIAAIINEKCGTSLSQYFISRYLNRSQEASEKYRSARLIAAQTLADKLSTITDEMLEGKRDAPSVRTASDNLKWLASRYNPQVFGDKLEVNATVLDIAQLHLASMRERMGVTIEGERVESPPAS